MPVDEAGEIAGLGDIEALAADGESRRLERFVAVVGQHVVEEHDRHPFREHRKIVFHPLGDLIHRIGRLVVAVRHRRYHEMDAAGLERTPAGAVKRLEAGLTGGSRDHIVVAETVDHRSSHCVGVHRQEMGAKPAVVADVAGMDDERRVVFLGYALYVLHPGRVVHSADLGISQMHE